MSPSIELAGIERLAGNLGQAESDAIPTASVKNLINLVKTVKAPRRRV